MKKLPKFKSEAEERRFWQKHDSSAYVDWQAAKEVALPNLKPSTRTISLRLPESMLDALKRIANQRDIPYQSLLKAFLAERLDAEVRPRARLHGSPVPYSAPGSERYSQSGAVNGEIGWVLTRGDGHRQRIVSPAPADSGGDRRFFGRKALLRGVADLTLDVKEDCMDLSQSQTEPFVQFSIAHFELNRTVKVGAAGLALLERVVDGANGPEIIGALIASTGEPWWSTQHQFADAVGSILRARAHLAEMAIVKAYSAFDNYLTEAAAELDRQMGASEPVSAPEEVDPEDPAAPTNKKSTLSRLRDRLNIDEGDVAPHLRPYDFFRLARNCFAHRNGGASRGLEEARNSHELARDLQKWAKAAKVTLPALPPITIDAPTQFEPRHAILASETCLKVATIIDKAVVQSLGVDGMTRMAVVHCLESGKLPKGFRLGTIEGKPKGGIALLNWALSNRYQVKGCDVKVTSPVLKRIGLLKAVRAVQVDQIQVHS